MKQATFLEQNPAARRAGDFYETPRWMTAALLRRVHLFSPILEPCVGNGAIAVVLTELGFTVITNDVDVTRPADRHLDATTDACWADDVAWVVSNPPFLLADAIIPRACGCAGFGGVAMLLRLSWLEPTDARQRFLSEHPPTRVIVLPRWSFRGTGRSDSVTSAWFIWDHNRMTPRGIDVVTKDEMRELQTRSKFSGHARRVERA